MDISIKTKYLVFPINSLASNKRIFFKNSGREVYALNVRLDNISPDFYAYIDVSRFKGMTLSLEITPSMDISFREADTMDIPDIYKEKFRPQVHFTTKNGWINDPNGLVYLNEKYHIFYQHNPTSTEWDNMHWGHAVSDDLLHWKEQDIALFPDETGAMFSGCAVADENNVLGLQKDENKTGILYYTATNPFSQWMAVSTDNFKTIKKYKNEAIIKTIAKEDRDPKVVFCDELNCYIMALYVDADMYTVFKSNDLVNWERFFDYTLKGEWEFPDIMKFFDSKGNRKYVFTSNTDHYIVMSVKDGEFVVEQELKPLFYHSENHAPVSFHNIPDGRCIRMIWMKTSNSLFKERFSGELSTLEYTLEDIDGEYYLAAKPIKEMEKLYCSSIAEKNIDISSSPYRTELEDKPYLIRLKGKMSPDALLEINFFGIKVKVDFKENKIIFPRKYPPYERACPINVVGKEFDLTLLVDRLGFEIFSNGGKSCMYCITENAVPDRNLPYFELTTLEGQYTLDEIELNSLNSIWN